MKNLFILLLALKIAGLATISWIWLVFWGIVALNWAILRALAKEAIKKGE